MRKNTNAPRSRRTLAFGRIRGAGTIAALVILSACDPTVPAGRIGPDTPGIASGRVLSLAGAPVAGARVAVAGRQEVRADSLGNFWIPGVRAAERIAVSVSADSFVTATTVYRIEPGRESFRTVRLIPRAAPVRIDAGRGGTVPLAGGGRVAFASASLLRADGGRADGDVFVRATYIDPTDTLQLAAAPGDFLGRGGNGGGAPLESRGMVEVYATDASGRELQLAPGRAATVVWPRREAGGSLYLMNGTDGFWDEEAPLTGDTQLRTLRQAWNWDVLMPFICIKVNARQAGVWVEAIGVTYSGRSEAVSGPSGMAVLGVKPLSVVRVQFSGNVLSSKTITTPPVAVLPAGTPLGTDAEKEAACPEATTTLVATLSVKREWRDRREMDGIYRPRPARSGGPGGQRASR